MYMSMKCFRYKVVMDLMRLRFGNHHHLTVDSWFASLKLMHGLRDRGTFSTGTVICARRGRPKVSNRSNHLKEQLSSSLKDL